jgi:hypothetical protein
MHLTRVCAELKNYWVALFSKEAGEAAGDRDLGLELEYVNRIVYAELKKVSRTGLMCWITGHIKNL